MMMPPPGGMPPGGMPPEMMQQAPMMPQAPVQEQMPDPAQMQQAVIQRLQELEMEKAELMNILQQMEGEAVPRGVEMTNPAGAMGGLLGLTGQEAAMQGGAVRDMPPGMPLY